jgi:chorismate dehydratase
VLRISVVDFLNARPLTWGLLHDPPEGVEVLRDTPSVCAARLAAGEVDAGLIPSIEYQRIPGLQAVRGLGIAASSEVRSVLLVSDVSRERIRSVSLDPASRTSAALTRILLKRVYGLEPAYREGPGPEDDDPVGALQGAADARLIIGDPALKTRLNGHVVLDLAALWRSFSGHPFVFAFWAMRSRGSAAERRVVEVLLRSWEAGRRRFDDIAREEAADSGLSEAVVGDYLRHALHYELDAGDLEGLRLFYRLAVEEGLLERERPLEYAPAS